MKNKIKFEPRTITVYSKKQLRALHAVIGGISDGVETKLGMKNANLDSVYYELCSLMDEYNVKPKEASVEVTVY